MDSRVRRPAATAIHSNTATYKPMSAAVTFEKCDSSVQNRIMYGTSAGITNNQAHCQRTPK